MLVFSLFICVAPNGSNGASLENVVHVKNEAELKNAVNNAVGSTIVALNKDIILTGSLNITNNKDITLTSNSRNEFYKLIGAPHQNTIIVEVGGTLKLDGIVVTHSNNEAGRGVKVDIGGTFILYSGEISGNTASYNVGDWGGGVWNWGTFEMYGGKISGNTASYGGGVVSGGMDGGGNFGLFVMFGGEICGNNATGGAGSGGVYNVGTFKMSDGKISGNTAYVGGGVLNAGSFSMSGGEISGNTAATRGGGVWNKVDFAMSGGEISGNTATDSGGGVYNEYSMFLFGDIIYYNSKVTLTGGKLSSNTANWGGGIGLSYTSGVEGLEQIFVSDGVVFENNCASVAYNRNSTHDALYNSQIGRRVTWTSPFTQGYNNYDIYYTMGTPIDGTDNGSSGGDGGSSNGNGGSGGNNGNGGSSVGDGFSLKDVVIIFAIVVIIVVGVLFVYFKKKVAQLEAKFNTISHGKVET